MSEPTYIPVAAMPVSIIKRCQDRACDKYHEWVRFDTRADYSTARVIADALNKLDGSSTTETEEQK